MTVYNDFNLGDLNTASILQEPAIRYRFKRELKNLNETLFNEFELLWKERRHHSVS